MIGLKRKREIGSVPAFVLEHSRLGARGSAKKIAQPMRVDNCSRKVWKLAKKSIEDRSNKNFPIDARQKLLKEGFESWRKGPSKIAARKNSQPMRAENCSRKVLEVGEEVHRRSLQQKFPNRCASKIAQGRS